MTPNNPTSPVWSGNPKAIANVCVPLNDAQLQTLGTTGAFSAVTPTPQLPVLPPKQFSWSLLL